MRIGVVLCLLLALAACSEQQGGEALVTTRLDGSDSEDSVTPSPTATPALAAGPSACRQVVFETVPLTDCVADPATHRIAMANVGADKQPFGSLSAFAASVDPSDIAFAVNGGMYGDDLRPIGYFVQNGERLSELNRANGDGNFYMKPNGVFFGTGSKWRVLGSNTFFDTVGDRPEFGTQSGPLMLIDGKMHPEIQDNGPSKAIRNGVGVDASGKAHFVISDAPISFGQLARYFRDELKVSNALYLDGQVSSLWDPATGRMDKGRVGPIIVVTKREAATPESVPSANVPPAG
ncbi:phosphodiester glycosidase family protein [Erythrobacter donghaensis]|uniref:phosphodiester glycosidase family protein n=1 Tax=Erythrobacter donghaensis TaxID=267135 RepID=UPI00146CE403|nr:phosphodiester glycosidase family protein [Erythrobacter donghaensis]